MSAFTLKQGTIDELKKYSVAPSMLASYLQTEGHYKDADLKQDTIFHHHYDNTSREEH